MLTHLWVSDDYYTVGLIVEYHTVGITVDLIISGIIVQPMSICVVREFCQKRSLMDILRMRDLKLDQLFIASFIEDLIKVR